MMTANFAGLRTTFFSGGLAAFLEITQRCKNNRFTFEEIGA